MARCGSRRSSAGVSVSLPFDEPPRPVDLLAELGTPARPGRRGPGPAGKDLVGHGEPRPGPAPRRGSRGASARAPGRPVPSTTAAHGVSFGLERPGERELAFGHDRDVPRWASQPRRRRRRQARCARGPRARAPPQGRGPRAASSPARASSPRGGREQRALREGDDPGSGRTPTLSASSAASAIAASRSIVLAEKQMRGAAQDECRRTPAARRARVSRRASSASASICSGPSAQCIARTRASHGSIGWRSHPGAALAAWRARQGRATAPRRRALAPRPPCAQASRTAISGMALQIERLVEPPEPRVHGFPLARAPGREGMSADKARDPVGVPGCVRVRDRRLRLPVLLAPGRGAAVEKRSDGRLAPLQLARRKSLNSR